jgi:hypothetical protein
VLAEPRHPPWPIERGGCVGTVQRALQQARHLGLVDWCERRVRAAWRWLRTSNLYRLLTPLAPVQAGLRAALWAAPATTGQNGRGGERSSKKEALDAMMQAAAAAPDLLAARRAVMAQRL